MSAEALHECARQPNAYCSVDRLRCCCQGDRRDGHDQPDRRQVEQSEGEPVQRLDARKQPERCRERGDGPAEDTGAGECHRPAGADPPQGSISKNTTTSANTDSDQTHA